MGCRAVRKIAIGPTGPVQQEGAPMNRLRVLLSEASGLTAREHLTVLGTAGVQVEAMSSGHPWMITHRAARWPA